MDRRTGRHINRQTHTGRQADKSYRHTDKSINTQTGVQANRHTNMQTVTQTQTDTHRPAPARGLLPSGLGADRIMLWFFFTSSTYCAILAVLLLISSTWGTAVVGAHPAPRSLRDAAERRLPRRSLHLVPQVPAHQSPLPRPGQAPVSPCQQVSQEPRLPPAEDGASSRVPGPREATAAADSGCLLPGKSPAWWHPQPGEATSAGQRVLEPSHTP